jgi:hypothetical protein
LASYFRPRVRRTQKTTRTRKPDWQPWVSFFLRALQKQKQRLEIKLDREKKILGQLPELSLRIFELAKDQGQIKVEDVLRVTGAARGPLTPFANPAKKNTAAPKAHWMIG